MLVPYNGLELFNSQNPDREGVLVPFGVSEFLSMSVLGCLASK